MSDGVRVLVVASWGDPRRWDEVSYRLSVGGLEHPGLRKVLGEGARELECRSRSSTVSLLCLLSRGGLEVHGVVFGLDTVASASSQNIRDDASKVYADRLEEFVDGSTCCEEIKEELRKKIDVVVTPGVGTYGGLSYRGSPTHIFTQAFMEIYKRLASVDPAFLVVDITHGINYQTTAVLYAAMTSAIVAGKERNLVIFNSEPPSPSAKPQRIGESSQSAQLSTGQPGPQATSQQASNPQSLGILDVTLLSNALRFAMAARDILLFRSKSISELSREASVKGSGRVAEALVSLETFTRLLENAAVALTFPGAVDEKGERLGYSLCSFLESFTIDPCSEIEYPPEKDDARKVVRYPSPETARVLECILYSVLRRLAEDERGKSNGLCVGAAKSDLVEYLGRVAVRLRGAGLKYASLIARREQQKLATFIETFQNCLNEFDKNIEMFDSIAQHLVLRENEVEVDVSLFHAFEELEQKKSKLPCTQILNDIKDRIKDFIKEEVIDENNARNISAHAGLSYTIIEKVVVSRQAGRWTVSKIKYNRDKVQKYLNLLVRI
ncbi:CRISPR-associated CARF protein Csx1 [Thermofilum sp.]|uniref:CRISPR-associated CARF protein Csx1 n=1 Tax=Thermofilum sp. TaxID=1961369 RepID=UPI00258EC6E9|nr:CRISPR-associated CARF protein Csx1 [Thermofilum sp.]